MPFRKWLQSTLGLSRDGATEQQPGIMTSWTASTHGNYSRHYYAPTDRQRPTVARSESVPGDGSVRLDGTRSQVGHQSVFQQRRENEQNARPTKEKQDPSAPPLLLQVMDRESIIEVASLLARLFPHHHLAICDHAAMALHGQSNLQPNYVSILCPTDEADDLLSKAQARGLRRCHLYPRAFYLMTSRDGVVVARCVRILTCRRFRCLDGVEKLLGPFCAPVLSLACVADRVARDYRRCLDNEPCHEVAVRRGADLIWLIANITHQSSSSPQDFLDSFTRRFPETILLLREAGFDIRHTHDGQQPSSKRRSRDGIVIPPSYLGKRNTAALLKRTMTLVHAATRFRLQGERARAASPPPPPSSSAKLWPAPLRLRPRPASCYGPTAPPEIPPRSRARLSLARSEDAGVRASLKSMELVIGKDIVLCRDWPPEHPPTGGQRKA
ncbi:hypothetical protein L249_0543 [Ophiocordyceps polyrhachis-furcata BCC 54312]|uniref:Uncharacterized protein n=1 Tax=Ophiocordyceps polyrhachis-furcata BCC 54312 TaxID=1330021 RepID=A0A367LEG3_9HYPO|nr:hypothetical protein L249_0543 [Ophiocordyceps polyrhachis-furcata BCC 54312]